MARTKQTARKVSGKSTTTKPSAEKEELLKLKRAERAEAKRVKHLKAEEDKNTGNATRPKVSRGVRGRGRRGGRGGVRRDASVQCNLLPSHWQEPGNSFEEFEERMSDRGFTEDEVNLEEICQCEGIPGDECEDDNFAVNSSIYIDAYSL